MAAMPLAASGATAVTLGNYIYVFAGEVDNLQRMNVYNVSNDTWQWTRANIPPFTGAAGFVVNNKFYIMGGITNSVDQPLYGVFDPNTGIFMDIPQPPFPMNTPAGGVLNNKIYLFGGVTGAALGLGNVLVYDIQSNAWFVFHLTLLQPCSGPAGGIIGNTIYVAGGSSLISGSAYKLTQAVTEQIGYLMKKL